jgi:methylated-DNA-[protein]-cysteine S-methyltransferase
MNKIAYYHSPLGWVEIQVSRDAVSSVIICDERKDDVGDHQPDSAVLAECIRQLDEYFGGQRTKFDLPVCQEGTTFQQSVWKALQDIPFGKTVSYAYVAKKLNKPTAARAVGAANGRNKIWIIIPCHRVIGANGSLTGYAGGLNRKQWLLAHEAKIVSGLKFEVSGSSLKPQTSNLKLETSNLKPQTKKI